MLGIFIPRSKEEINAENIKAAQTSIRLAYDNMHAVKELLAGFDKEYNQAEMLLIAIGQLKQTLEKM